ncbi:MAG: hypothetical protein MJA30_28200 [Cytophagales bacterium]|nr:hypothetical protein [Cytophagales bacterium]
MKKNLHHCKEIAFPVKAPKAYGRSIKSSEVRSPADIYKFFSENTLAPA